MIEKIKQIFKLGKAQNTVPEKTAEEQIDELYDTLISEADIIRIEIGEDFVPFGNDIVKQISEFRENKKDENGFILPAVHVIDNPELQENEFIVKLRGKTCYQEFVIPNRESIIEEIALKLEQCFEEHIEEIFTIEAVEKCINLIAAKNSYLIWNITNVLTVQGIKLILINILKEGKSIKDITYIFEKISEVAIQEGHNFIYNPKKIAKEIIELV